jgi:hypothetical protein
MATTHNNPQAEFRNPKSRFVPIHARALVRKSRTKSLVAPTNMDASSCLWPTSDEACGRKWAATYVAKNVISRQKSGRHKSRSGARRQPDLIGALSGIAKKLLKTPRPPTFSRGGLSRLVVSAESFQRQATAIKQRVSRIKDPPSRIKHRVSSIKDRASCLQHSQLAPRNSRLALNAPDRQTSNHCPPSRTAVRTG